MNELIEFKKWMGLSADLSEKSMKNYAGGVKKNVNPEANLSPRALGRLRLEIRDVLSKEIDQIDTLLKSL